MTESAAPLPVSNAQKFWVIAGFYGFLLILPLVSCTTGTRNVNDA